MASRRSKTTSRNALERFVTRARSSSRPAKLKTLSLRLECLEERMVLSFNPWQADPIYAPGTPQSVMDAHPDSRRPPYSSSSSTSGAQPFVFNDLNRWQQTATDGPGLTQGDPTTILWSIVADGTTLPSGNQGAGEPAANSNLVAFLDGIYGGGNGPLANRPWFPVVNAVFARWSVLSGVNYVYQAADDGVAIDFANPGVIGVRGDVRIGGHTIDGNSGILAYDYFPDFSDMVIDTGDNFFNDTSNNSLKLRNVMAHEAGHGLGLDHVIPTDQTKLMEPFVSTAYDGPQPDDILAVNRGYGDDREDNDTPATPNSLGTIVNGTTTFNTLSIDDVTDPDFYRINITDPKSLTITVRPTGSTYLSGPQGGTATPFNSLAQSNLALQVFSADGSILLASANVNPIGQPETVTVDLDNVGDYLVKITGDASKAQMYDLDFTASDLSPPGQLTISDVSVIEGDVGTTPAVFNVRLRGGLPNTVAVNFTTVGITATPNVDFIPMTGTLVFFPGETLKTITIPVIGDFLAEPNETFDVILLNAIGAPIFKNTGVGTIIDDDQPIPNPIVVAADAGGGPHVKLYDPATGRAKFSFFAYAANFTGGVRVAVGDVNGDGRPDIITGAGPGGGPHVRVFDGGTGQQIPGILGSFFATASNYTGGVYVAAADFTGDGFADIVTSTGLGANAEIRIIDSSTGADFFKFKVGDSGYTKAMRVAAADVNGDGTMDLIVTGSDGDPAQVKIYTSLTRNLNGQVVTTLQMFPYNSSIRSGVFAAGGNVDSFLDTEIVVGPGAGLDSVVKVIVPNMFGSISLPFTQSEFTAFDNFQGGVRIALVDPDNDGVSDIVTAAGPGGGPHVKIFNGSGGSTDSLLASFFAFDSAFRGGVNVAGMVRKLGQIGVHRPSTAPISSSPSPLAAPIRASSISTGAMATSTPKAADTLTTAPISQSVSLSSTTSASTYLSAVALDLDYSHVYSQHAEELAALLAAEGLPHEDDIFSSWK